MFSFNAVTTATNTRFNFFKNDVVVASAYTNDASNIVGNSVILKMATSDTFGIKLIHGGLREDGSSYPWTHFIGMRLAAL